MRSDFGILDVLIWVIVGIFCWENYKDLVKKDEDNLRRDREIDELKRKLEDFKRKRLSS